MGRGGGKLSMKLIVDDRSRRVTFQKRKKGIFKKAEELSILCGVDACLIIYGPKQSDRRPGEVHTWPQNQNEVNRIIKKFQLSTMNKPATRSCTLSDLLQERKVKMDANISKLRRDMYEAKYPTWDDRIDHFLEEQLEELVYVLDQKIESGKRTLINERNAPQKLVMDGNHVANVTSQKFSTHHMQDYAHYHGEYEDQKSRYMMSMSMMDIHMPFSIDQQPTSYSQMLQCDSDLNAMVHPTSFYEPLGANQTIHSSAENMLTFNNVSSLSMSHYAQLLQKPMQYTLYPMNVSTISSQLGIPQVKDLEEEDLN